MRTIPTGETAYLARLDPAFPSSLQVTAGSPLIIGAGDSAYGYGLAGEGRAEVAGRVMPLGAGTFFSLPGPVTIDAMTGLVAVRHGFSCLTLIGVLERRGRLPYIDGCSDTLLIAPPVKGDPCLNYLHMPPGTRQSPHTHPSVRIGVIAGGQGWCVTPTSRQPLAAGLAFVLEPGELHCFHTLAEAMHIVVYHPDSDFGPEPHDHPMINKTILARPAGRPTTQCS